MAHMIDRADFSGDSMAMPPLSFSRGKWLQFPDSGKIPLYAKEISAQEAEDMIASAYASLPYKETSETQGATRAGVRRLLESDLARFEALIERYPEGTRQVLKAHGVTDLVHETRFAIDVMERVDQL